MGGVDNLRAIFEAATASEIRNGCQWYADAKKGICALAGEFGLDRRVVAAVVAALSPMCKWGRNMIDARNLIKVWSEGLGPGDVKVCTFDRNKRTAFAILEAADPGLLSGQKVSCFYRNLAGDLSCATIDRHAFNAWLGRLDQIGDRGLRITPRRYEAASADYALLADEAGMEPAQVQAIIWLAWRRANVPSRFLDD